MFEENTQTKIYISKKFYDFVSLQLVPMQRQKCLWNRLIPTRSFSRSKNHDGVFFKISAFFAIFVQLDMSSGI